MLNKDNICKYSKLLKIKDELLGFSWDVLKTFSIIIACILIIVLLVAPFVWLIFFFEGNPLIQFPSVIGYVVFVLSVFYALCERSYI